MIKGAPVQWLLITGLAALPGYTGAAGESGDTEGFQPWWYLSAGGGSTFLEPEGESAGFSATGEDGTGAKIALGQLFKPNWGWELSYLDAGEAALSNPNPAIQALVPGAAIDYNITSAFATYYLGDADSTFRLIAKLGASSISNQATDSRIIVSKDNSTQAAYGVGVEMKLPSRWFIRAEYESYARDAAYAGLSLGFRFGGRTSEPASAVEISQKVPTVIEYPLYVPEEQAAVVQEDRRVVSEVADELSDVSAALRAASAQKAGASPDQAREAAHLDKQADILTETGRRMGIVEESILKVREIEDFSQVDPEQFVNERGERLLLTPAEQSAELTVARRNIEGVEQSIGDMPIIRSKLIRVRDRIAVVSESLLYVPPWEEAEAEQLCNELEILQKTIQFHSESIRLTDEARRFLDQVAVKMKRHPRIVLAVHAHTDSWGDYTFNQRLSEHRARGALDYLVGKGVAEARLTAVGYGEWQPVASNKTAEGRRQNRRVEFIIQNPNVCRSQPQGKPDLALR